VLIVQVYLNLKLYGVYTGSIFIVRIQEKELKMDLTDNQKFEALKLRYTDHVELLRSITKLDVQIFSGYITVQLALGAWLGSHPINLWPKIGLSVIDLVLAVIALKLLHKDFLRRKEVVGIIENINEALNFNTEGAYLPGKSINDNTNTRPWFSWFVVGIIAGFIGIVIILVTF